MHNGKWPLVITEGRGKLKAWHRAIRQMGLHPRCVMTVGHVFAYPEDLDPLGFSFTEAGVVEHGRQPREAFCRRIASALRNCPPGTPILIAADADAEGDVIAFDVAQTIRRLAPALLARTFRARPASMHAHDLQAVVEAAIADPGHPREGLLRCALMERDAVPGRARAIIDRGLGRAHSEDAGAPCGRVKAAGLGAVRMWRKRPEALLRRPETGEIHLRAAAADGGRPFTARLALHGPVRGALARLAVRFAGADVPGAIHQPASLGAAVAARAARAPLLDTGAAIVAACRRHGVGVHAVMAGLQKAYLAGMIGYPRTAERRLSSPSALRVAEFAQKCGISGLHDCAQGWDGPAPPEGAHEALHPARGASVDYVQSYLRAAPSPGEKPDGLCITGVMLGIISERCFEAMRGVPLAWGVHRPTPGADLSDAEIAALRELEWTRPMAEPPHQAGPPGTALRHWPLDAIMADLMASEGLGRPSTWANHIYALKRSGWVDFPSEPDGSPPALSPRGQRILERLPPSAADPETSRQMQRILEDVPCRPDGTLKAPLPQTVAQLVLEVCAAQDVADARLRSEILPGDARPAKARRPRAEAHGDRPEAAARSKARASGAQAPEPQRREPRHPAPTAPKLWTPDQTAPGPELPEPTAPSGRSAAPAAVSMGDAAMPESVPAPMPQRAAAPVADLRAAPPRSRDGEPDGDEETPEDWPNTAAQEGWPGESPRGAAAAAQDTRPGAAAQAPAGAADAKPAAAHVPPAAPQSPGIDSGAAGGASLPAPSKRPDRQAAQPRRHERRAQKAAAAPGHQERSAPQMRERRLRAPTAGASAPQLPEQPSQTPAASALTPQSLEQRPQPPMTGAPAPQRPEQAPQATAADTPESQVPERRPQPPMADAPVPQLHEPPTQAPITETPELQASTADASKRRQLPEKTPQAPAASVPKPKPPERRPQPPMAGAPAPDSADAHHQRPSGPAPHGAAAAHGNAAEPIKDGACEMTPVEGGYVSERMIEHDGRTWSTFEFYNAAGFTDFRELRDAAGNRCQAKFNARTDAMQPVAPDDPSADPRIRWRARRARPRLPEPSEPPEPDCDCDYDYDDDLSPSM